MRASDSAARNAATTPPMALSSLWQGMRIAMFIGRPSLVGTIAGHGLSERSMADTAWSPIVLLYPSNPAFDAITVDSPRTTVKISLAENRTSGVHQHLSEIKR